MLTYYFCVILVVTHVQQTKSGQLLGARLIDWYYVNYMRDLICDD